MKTATIRTSLFNSVFVSAIIFIILLIITSCKEEKKQVTRIEKNWPKHIFIGANRYKLEYMRGYSQLSILNPWQGAKNVLQQWYLVPRGDKPPPGIDTSMVIYVPLKRIICMSTTHAAMIKSLDESKSLYGFSGTKFIFDTVFVGRVNKGIISEVGYEDNLNKEKIISISPDLVMIYGIGSESAGYVSKLKELGIKTLFNADYLETHPLGKAEWIKVFGALYNKKAMADSIYEGLEKKYLDLKKYIMKNIKDRPKVLLGLPFKDAWFISPGNSYISTLIEDAGGTYLWKETQSSVSMPFSIEKVFAEAVQADFWLNIGSVCSKEEIVSIDSRLKDLPCYQSGNLFNNNKRVNQNGGNDYWEGGCMSPDIILKDIASILHPDLFRGYKMVYYQKIN